MASSNTEHCTAELWVSGSKLQQSDSSTQRSTMTLLSCSSVGSVKVKMSCPVLRWSSLTHSRHPNICWMKANHCTVGLCQHFFLPLLSFFLGHGSYPLVVWNDYSQHLLFDIRRFYNQSWVCLPSALLLLPSSVHSLLSFFTSFSSLLWATVALLYLVNRENIHKQADLQGELAFQPTFQDSRTPPPIQPTSKALKLYHLCGPSTHRRTATGPLESSVLQVCLRMFLSKRELRTSKNRGCGGGRHHAQVAPWGLLSLG